MGATGLLGIAAGGGGMGLVSAATVTGLLSDAATANVAPVVTNGQSIPLDTEDWVLRLDFSSDPGTIDPTKLTVNVTRPGYNSTVGGAAITRSDVAYGVKELRRAFNNQTLKLGTGTTRYITVDNSIKASDTVSISLAAGFYTGSPAITVPTGSITRADARVYEQPMLRPVTPPWRRYTTSATVEFGAISEWAAFGSQVARVEARGKINGSYGPWAGSGTMVRSEWTPSSGRAPSGIPVPVYQVTVDLSSLADSASRTDSMIVYRCYGWFGDVIFDSETHGDALGATGTLTSLSPPVGLPIIKDVAGNHTPIYAWVNRDGTAGGSAAISTGTSDPGSAGSYASENAAFVAARAWNNSGSNRTNPHNTTSGIILLYRDVAGGSLGDSTKSYWQRATMAGFSDGLVPPVLCSASYLSTGTTTLDCRRRGVQDDGTTVATSKFYSGVYELRGLTLDSMGLSGAPHQILDGNSSGASTSAASATVGTILIDCDVREVSTGGSSTPALSRAGWQWHYRVDVGGINAGEGPTGTINSSTIFGGVMVSAGSLYSRGSVTNIFVCAGVFGGWFRNCTLGNQSLGGAPTVEYAIGYHARFDVASPSSASFNLAALRPVRKGAGFCGVLVRATGTYGGPTVRIAGDFARWEISNIVLQHFGVDSGFNDDSDRVNSGYGDQGYIQIAKRMTNKYCAWGSYNIKDDLFLAPEAPGTAGDGGWTASTVVNRGTLFHDNNATPASRLWYQRLTDGTTGTVQATDLADTSAWVAAGAVNGTSYGQQPLRTGNWRNQHGVRNFGNCATKTANSDTGTNPSSWYGEAWGRGGKINAVWADYYKTRTGGTLSTFTTWGDYRPKSTAAGDSANSDLLSRVPAGGAVSPFDLLGVARLNDGTGAAGPYERSA